MKKFFSYGRYKQKNDLYSVQRVSGELTKIFRKALPSYVDNINTEAKEIFTMFDIINKVRTLAGKHAFLLVKVIRKTE